MVPIFPMVPTRGGFVFWGCDALVSSRYPIRIGMHTTAYKVISKTTRFEQYVRPRVFVYVVVVAAHKM